MKTPELTDWAEVRQRLDAVRTAIEHGFAPSPEEERRILKARAQALAQEPARGVAAGEILEVVEFDLAGESYAFALAQVREVSALREFTPVPGTPDFVLGIINLRGEIRTVIDLKKFFDLPDSGLTQLNQIILLEHDGGQLGILADAIRGVRRVPFASLQPTLPTLTDRRGDYLRGLTGDRLVVLDAAKLLSDPRLLVDEEVSP
jgi:purine-binding chemotaxis protein CheW